MQYENFPQINKQEAELILSKQNIDSKTIIQVIVSSLIHINDCIWLENMCLKYIKHNDYWVQKNVINGLGDLVRIYGKLNNMEQINILLEEIIKEKPLLRGEIDNLKDDIKVFS